MTKARSRRTCAAAAVLAATTVVVFAYTDFAPGPITVVHRPYLQKVSGTTASVVWATVEPGSASLRVTPPTGDPFEIAATTTPYPATTTGLAFDYYQHEARAEALAPATTYAYETFVNGAGTGSESLTTFPLDGAGTVRFAAFGDSGTGRSQQRQISSLVGADARSGRIDLVLHVGDVSQRKGTYPAYHNWFFLVYGDWLGRTPVYPAIGNHDEYGFRGQPYYEVFALPENGATPAFPDHRERFYSFDAGPVHFVALDTQTAFSTKGGSRAAQLAWLDADLAATRQPWRVVYFHRPAYTIAPCCTDVRAAFAPVLERHGVQLVLAGSDHLYARSVPWKSSDDPGRSPIVHVVTGGGGASLNLADGLADWKSVAKKAWHYVRGTVSGCGPSDACRLELEAVGLNGAVFDTYSLDLRAQLADVAPASVQLLEAHPGSRVTGALTAIAQADDDVRVEKVDLLLGGRLVGIAPAPPYAFSWPTASTPDGPYELRARAYDVAGRATLSDPVAIELANGGAWLVAPNGGERLSTGTRCTIKWTASEAAEPLVRFDVSVAAGKGAFLPIAECAALAPDVRSCGWASPSPVSGRVVLRIVATGLSGTLYEDRSDATFRIAR